MSYTHRDSESNISHRISKRCYLFRCTASSKFEKLAVAAVFFIFGTIFSQWIAGINNASSLLSSSSSLPKSVNRTRATPYVFIGGHESSGTGLMRIKLDAHPWIRCGAEPMITLEVLHLWHRFTNQLKNRSIKAGIYPDAINNATRAYIQETIERMGPDARVLCHKQPTTFVYLSVLGKLFPTAKFIHMVRDGRATVTSSINRKLLGRAQPQKSLEGWQSQVTNILKDCADLGPDRCINVRYEALILRTEKELRRIFDFIGVPWDPIVLHHEAILDKLTNLNSFEPSTKQFSKAVHNESLAAWAEPNSAIPKEILENSCQTIPLLKQLDYCPTTGYLPDYAKIPSTIKYP